MSSEQWKPVLPELLWISVALCERRKGWCWMMWCQPPTLSGICTDNSYSDVKKYWIVEVCRFSSEEQWELLVFWKLNFEACLSVKVCPGCPFLFHSFMPAYYWYFCDPHLWNIQTLHIRQCIYLHNNLGKYKSIAILIPFSGWEN